MFDVILGSITEIDRRRRDAQWHIYHDDEDPWVNLDRDRDWKFLPPTHSLYDKLFDYKRYQTKSGPKSHQNGTKKRKTRKHNTTTVSVKAANISNQNGSVNCSSSSSSGSGGGGTKRGRKKNKDKDKDGHSNAKMDAVTSHHKKKQRKMPRDDHMIHSDDESSVATNSAINERV